MLKRLGIAAWLLLAASSPVFAQAGQAGANQIWGNATAAPKAPKANNIGSFLTPGAGISITGTPKATIGITNSVTAAGPMGSATQTVVLTYNAQGQITAATLATIAPPFSAITGSLACSQMPALTGNVTTSAGACATTIGAGVVTFANIATAAISTSAQYLAGTANTLVPASVIYTAQSTITQSGGTISYDFNTFTNAVTILTGNITTMNVSNVKAGQAGSISLGQPASGGPFTVTLNSVFKFAGGVTPTTSTTANADDVLFFNCVASTFCIASLVQNVH